MPPTTTAAPETTTTTTEPAPHEIEFCVVEDTDNDGLNEAVIKTIVEGEQIEGVDYLALDDPKCVDEEAPVITVAQPEEPTHSS
jgi:hypothetical protein